MMRQYACLYCRRPFLVDEHRREKFCCPACRLAAGPAPQRPRRDWETVTKSVRPVGWL